MYVESSVYVRIHSMQLHCITLQYIQYSTLQYSTLQYITLIRLDYISDLNLNAEFRFWYRILIEVVFSGSAKTLIWM